MNVRSYPAKCDRARPLSANHVKQTKMSFRKVTEFRARSTRAAQAVGRFDAKLASKAIYDVNAGRIDAPFQSIGKVINSMYKTGRSGFIFTARDFAVVTSSGADSPAKGDQATICLDKVIFTLIGTSTPPQRHSGQGHLYLYQPICRAEPHQLFGRDESGAASPPHSCRAANLTRRCQCA